MRYYTNDLDQYIYGDLGLTQSRNLTSNGYGYTSFDFSRLTPEQRSKIVELTKSDGDADGNGRRDLTGYTNQQLEEEVRALVKDNPQGISATQSLTQILDNIP